MCIYVRTFPDTWPGKLRRTLIPERYKLSLTRQLFFLTRQRLARDVPWPYAGTSRRMDAPNRVSSILLAGSDIEACYTDPF